MLNNVLDSFALVNTSGVFHYEFDEFIYNENIEMQFSVFNFKDAIYSSYFSMGNRRSDFYDVNYKYHLKLEDERYEGIGCVDIPEMDVILVRYENPSFKIPIKYLYMKGWDDAYYQYDAHRLYYEDNIGVFTLHNSELFTSRDIALGLFTSNLEECVPKVHILKLGSVILDFKF